MEIRGNKGMHCAVCGRENELIGDAFSQTGALFAVCPNCQFVDGLLQEAPAVQDSVLASVALLASSPVQLESPILKQNMEDDQYAYCQLVHSGVATIFCDRAEMNKFLWFLYGLDRKTPFSVLDYDVHHALMDQFCGEAYHWCET